MDSSIASLGARAFSFSRTRWGASSHRYVRDKRPRALVVERQSEYAIDYDLMFNKFGFRSLFATIPGEAGRAVSEDEDISVVLIDADTVDLRRCLTVLHRMRPLKLIVVAGPDAEIDEYPCDVRLVRKPLVIRELEKEVAYL